MLVNLTRAIQTCEQMLQQGMPQADAPGSLSEFAAACQTIGNMLQGMGRFEDAITWHTRALESSPNLRDIYASFGKLYIMQEQWSDAVRAYQQTLQHDPHFAEAYWKLAAIAKTLNHQSDALRYWFRALTLEPHKATAAGHYRLGNALVADGKGDQAIACYTRAIRINPRFAPAYERLGQIFRNRGWWRREIATYREAIEQVRPVGWLYAAIGQVYLRQGEIETAIAHFRQGMEAEPSFVWCYHDLAEALMRQGQWQEAREVIQAAIALGPHPWAYSQMGRVMAQLEHRDEAIACHQTASDLRGWHTCKTRDYHFTQDWFTHNIPLWNEHVQPLVHQPHLQCLEIGSYQGMSACWLLDQVLTHPSSHLTCVDPGFQPEFDANIAKTGKADQVTKRIGNSHHVLPTLPRRAFDLIYIDGCHLADHVRQDGLLALPLLKPGGLLIFDDYLWTDPEYPGQDPKRGIDAVLRQGRHQLTLLHRDYQIIAQSTS